MTLTDVLEALENLGTEQTRRTFRRHGAGENVYGVKFGDLDKLKKKIKIDHELALELWATGNYDARNLAVMIADPAKATEKMLTSWVKDLDNYGAAGMLATYAGATPPARKLAEKWVDSDNEWIGRTGWLMMAYLANKSELPDEYFEPYMVAIELEIHGRKNWVREAMNGALIAFGLREGLRENVLAIARKIGKVDVDYGDTSCKMPDVAEYIMRTVERRAKGKGMEV